MKGCNSEEVAIIRSDFLVDSYTSASAMSKIDFLATVSFYCPWTVKAGALGELARKPPPTLNLI